MRVVDGTWSWQPVGWGAPVWQVPVGEVIGGAASALSAFELWLESPVTGTVGVAVDPPGGPWVSGGGEPRSLWSRPGHGGIDLGWPV